MAAVSIDNDEYRLSQLCQDMYEMFGQHAVINFIKDRQENGDLLYVKWNECNGCEFNTPFLGNDCLVCGEHDGL